FNDQFGIVNVVLEALGFEGQPWLAQRWTAFAVIVLTDVWLWTPWFTLLLLAGLQSLPREPFEAAAIDGAGRFSVLRFVAVRLLRRAVFVGIVALVCGLFAFPVLWLGLTSLRPQSGVYYVHRGTELTLGNFVQVLHNERIVQAFVNSALISTLATLLSLMVTVTSGYMLSRFRGGLSRAWFGTIYVF